MESVILVDAMDRPRGLMEKMEAHIKAELHRAFSVFIFNHKGETMLQRRALSKYHSPGLWTNTCCSHPREGETVDEAALRRMEEEMGFTTEVKKVFDFVYKAEVGQGLIEHEFDHVLIGFYENPPVLNPEEAMDWKWMNMADIANEMETNPERFTVWFRIAFPRVKAFVDEKMSFDNT